MLRGLASAKLALVLVFLVILVSLAGALLPQEGMFDAHTIGTWQKDHPTVTTLLEPLGMFRAFHSIPFMAIILLLGINTLTCTVLRFLKEGGTAALKGPRAPRIIGFIVLHLSLIGLFAGGFISAGATMDGYILLTEGQQFTENHRAYMRLVEGPLRREHHQHFTLTLKKITTSYENDYLVGVATDVEVHENRTKKAEDTIRVNYPFTYNGVSFTHDKTGFSPRISIRDTATGKQMVNAFLALRTFKLGPRDWEYSDYIPLPILTETLGKRLVFTLYPAFTREGTRAVKRGHQPDNPLLLAETEDDEGKREFLGEIPMGQTLRIGNYLVGFHELRRWASFRVMHDPGYLPAIISLWLGALGLLLRYIPDLRAWFKEPKTTTETGKTTRNASTSDQNMVQ